MEAPVVPTEPDQSAAVAAALGLESAPAPETPAPPPVEAAPFDPASFTIPDRISDTAPKALEKFKNKTLLDIAKSYEESEKGFHGKAQELAQARREAEELRTKLAAAEQYARMNQQPAAPQAPLDPWQGVNPDSDIITDPRKVLDRTLSEGERRAHLVAQQEAAKVRDEIVNGIRAEREQEAIFNTFEVAKFKLRQAGYNLTDDQWKEDLKFIAPVVAREEQLFNPERYVQHFQYLRGPIKATLPKEGNPPVAARTATAAPHVPTISSEERQLRERLANVWGMSGDERANYIERGGKQ
jgi:hypothetical protein